MMYQRMAYIYDRLMGEEVYDSWLKFIEAAWNQAGMKHPMTILDLGCGTGTLSVCLAKQGHRVIGLDRSEHMLAISQEKAQSQGVQASILWVHQNMAELELDVSVDVVLSLCDSLNYLLEEDQVRDTFRKVYEHLKPGGLFIFDVHTPHRLVYGLGDQTFTWNEEDLAYIWESELNRERLEVTHHLTFFVEESAGMSVQGGQMSKRYLRFEETHTERAYAPEKLIEWLTEEGFKVISLTGDFRDEILREDHERAFFICGK
jgi:ubiquinone/menaquinone biosynthesis C-methylase UbiE